LRVIVCLHAVIRWISRIAVITCAPAVVGVFISRIFSIIVVTACVSVVGIAVSRIFSIIVVTACVSVVGIAVSRSFSIIIVTTCASVVGIVVSRSVFGTTSFFIVNSGRTVCRIFCLLWRLFCTTVRIFLIVDSRPRWSSAARGRTTAITCVRITASVDTGFGIEANSELLRVARPRAAFIVLTHLSNRIATGVFNYSLVSKIRHCSGQTIFPLLGIYSIDVDFSWSLVIRAVTAATPKLSKVRNIEVGNVNLPLAIVLDNSNRMVSKSQSYCGMFFN
jgi:hypothetical protein